MLGHWLSTGFLVVGAAAVLVAMLINRRGIDRPVPRRNMTVEEKREYMRRHTLIGRHPRLFLGALALLAIMLLIGPKHWLLY